MGAFWLNIRMLNAWKEDKMFPYQEEFVPVDISEIYEFLPEQEPIELSLNDGDEER